MFIESLQDQIQRYSSELRYNFKRRTQNNVYKARARKLSKKLRECRTNHAWMLGLNPFDADERRQVRIRGILKEKKRNQ
jgi:hypothetical protein